MEQIFLVAADYFHTEGNQYMYEIFAVCWICTDSRRCHYFIFFIFFLYQKKTHNPKPEPNQSAYHGLKNKEENTVGGKHPQETQAISLDCNAYKKVKKGK